MQISAQHLAQLLIGIARAQAAIVQGTLKDTRNHPEPTLVDLPVRILLSTLSGPAGPDMTSIAKDLERLCAGGGTPGSPGKDLDFGAPPP